MSSKGKKRSGIGKSNKDSKKNEPAQDRGVEALGVSVILNKIFKKLSHSDLLNCSLVNKTWNDEARRELREHHIHVAHIRESDANRAICRRLKEFEQDLCGMRVIPFNSMKIEDPWHHKSSMTCIGYLWKNYPTILSTKWKQIEFYREPPSPSINSTPDPRCGIVKILNELVQANAGHLVEFRMHGLPRGLPNYLDPRCGAVSEGLAFHNLKTLKCGRNFNEMIDYFRGIEKDINFFVANLFLVAPNVEEILTMVTPAHVKYLTVDFLKRCKFFTYNYPYTHDDPWYDKVLLARPKLTELVVDSNNFRPHLEHSQSLGQFINATCQDSLEMIKADFIAAILLSIYVTSSIQHLTEVTLSMNPTEIEMNRLTSFIKLFFIKVAPNANIVTVNVKESTVVLPQDMDSFKTWIQNEAMGAFLEREILRFGNLPEPHGIDLLLKYQKTWRNKAEPTQSLLLASMCFNNVKALTIDSHRADSINLELMWNSWPELEELTVCDKLKNITTKTDGFNMDATFCGISTEEASALRKSKDPLVVKDLHLVQIRPGLANFQKLKRLNFTLKDDGIERLISKDMFLSNVTGHLVLEQMPDLEFTIKGSNRLLSKLKHLKQFNIKLEELLVSNN